MCVSPLQTGKELQHQECTEATVSAGPLLFLLSSLRGVEAGAEASVCLSTPDWLSIMPDSFWPECS